MCTRVAVVVVVRLLAALEARAAAVEVPRRLGVLAVLAERRMVRRGLLAATLAMVPRILAAAVGDVVTRRSLAATAVPASSYSYLDKEN
jgi:hypothetical protein